MDAYLAEYRKLSGLEQRNVVTIYEVGQTDDVGYVAFELLNGGGLTHAMSNKLPVGLALNCLAQMCLALDAVHGIGIVHGALRPEHFLFREDGVLVLADFNVVKHVCDTMGLAYPADIQHRSQVRSAGIVSDPAQTSARSAAFSTRCCSGRARSTEASQRPGPQAGCLRLPDCRFRFPRCSRAWTLCSALVLLSR